MEPCRGRVATVGSCTLLGLGRSTEALTTWISPQDQLSDLIVDEDEETVGEGAEPPGDPEETEESVKGIRGCFKGTRTWILAGGPSKETLT